MNNKDQYYVTFYKKNVELRNMNKTLIRKFTMKADVVNAQVSGAGENASIAITMKDGKTYVYKSNGTLVRK